MNDPDLCLEVI